MRHNRGALNMSSLSNLVPLQSKRPCQGEATIARFLRQGDTRTSILSESMRWGT